MMGKKISLFVIMYSILLPLSLYAKNSICYELTNGRLGDQMIVYAHTLLLAETYQLNFLYKPFDRAKNFKFQYGTSVPL
jgi:hypothetical protein